MDRMDATLFVTLSLIVVAILLLVIVHYSLPPRTVHCSTRYFTCWNTSIYYFPSSLFCATMIQSTKAPYPDS